MLVLEVVLANIQYMVDLLLLYGMQVAAVEVPLVVVVERVVVALLPQLARVVERVLVMRVFPVDMDNLVLMALVVVEEEVQDMQLNTQLDRTLKPKVMMVDLE